MKLTNVLAIISEDETVNQHEAIETNHYFIFYTDGTYFYSYYSNEQRFWGLEEGALTWSPNDKEGSYKYFFNDPERNDRISRIIQNALLEREVLEVKMKSYTQLVLSDVNGLTVKQLKEALQGLPETCLVTIGQGAIACKVAQTFVADESGDTDVFVEIYDEKP